MLSLASPLSPAFPHDFLGDSEYRRERSQNSTTRSVGGFTNVGFPIYDAHGNMVATLARSGSTFTLNNKRSFDAWGSEGEVPPNKVRGMNAVNQVRQIRITHPPPSLTILRHPPSFRNFGGYRLRLASRFEDSKDRR